VIAEYSTAPPTSTTAVKYYHQDRLSSRMITDSNGNVIGTEDVLPFGEDAGTPPGVTEKHRFTTYERDGETGTDYAVNRQYASTLGRMMQPDRVAGSMTNPQTLNRYSYALSDPINIADPTGNTLWYGLNVYLGFYAEGALVDSLYLGFIPLYPLNNGGQSTPQASLTWTVRLVFALAKIRDQNYNGGCKDFFGGVDNLNKAIRQINTWGGIKFVVENGPQWNDLIPGLAGRSGFTYADAWKYGKGYESIAITLAWNLPGETAQDLRTIELSAHFLNPPQIELEHYNQTPQEYQDSSLVHEFIAHIWMNEDDASVAKDWHLADKGYTGAPSNAISDFIANDCKPAK
jgi:RHS repeat-associated protein